ncbi:MAG: hypothetical protein OJF62_002927 [Pseudolabrys sp.]|nr:hypothetical protein [Pseudolabrys sp.]
MLAFPSPRGAVGRGQGWGASCDRSYPRSGRERLQCLSSRRYSKTAALDSRCPQNMHPARDLAQHGPAGRAGRAGRRQARSQFDSSGRRSRQNTDQWSPVS